MTDPYDLDAVPSPAAPRIVRLAVLVDGPLPQGDNAVARVLAATDREFERATLNEVFDHPRSRGAR